MKKINKYQKEESGQIIIILAVSLIVILGVAALAVDGGMLYTERRFAQNAADASSLAGASKIANDLVDNDIYYSNFSCNLLESSYKDIGIDFASQRAVTNNFLDLVEVENTSINHGIFVDCHEEVNNKYVDFYVTITTETPTSFLYLISDNLLYSTVEAVTRLIPQHDVGYGNAIVALNDSCSNPGDGLGISGTTEINISGGGLWSNDCIRVNGPPNDVSPLVINLISTDENPDPRANLLDPDGINLINGTLNPPDPNIWTSDDALDLSVEANEINGLLQAECDTFTGSVNDITVHNGDVENLYPGRYGSLRVTDGELNFMIDPETGSSLFCFSDEITINGGTVHGDPVTIYMEGVGDVNISANAEVTLIAPFAENREDELSILDGILIFSNPSIANDIFLGGDGTSYFAGTVFTLLGDVNISGNPSVDSAATQVFSTQIIANNVDIGGNVAININFDINNTSIVDSKLHLLR